MNRGLWVCLTPHPGLLPVRGEGEERLRALGFGADADGGQIDGMETELERGALGSQAEVVFFRGDEEGVRNKRISIVAAIVPGFKGTSGKLE
jgi:hypothetical protein